MSKEIVEDQKAIKDSRHVHGRADNNQVSTRGNKAHTFENQTLIKQQICSTNSYRSSAL